VAHQAEGVPRATMGAAWAAEKRAEPGSTTGPARSPAIRSALKNKSGRSAPLQRRGWCAKRARGRVTWRRTVQVAEFARTLDGGGTVPGDGSKVTLGLGRQLRVSAAPLVARRPAGEAPIEERAWVPSCERVRLLRASMGDARYTAAWLRHREEVVRMARTRKQSNEEDPKDRLLMPTSFKEARQRAEALGRFASEGGSSSCDLKPQKILPPTLLKKVPYSSLFTRRSKAPRAASGRARPQDTSSAESSPPLKKFAKQRLDGDDVKKSAKQCFDSPIVISASTAPLLAS